MCAVGMLELWEWIYRSRGLGVEQQDWIAVECLWFKSWSFRNKRYRTRGLGVEQREEVAVECLIAKTSRQVTRAAGMVFVVDLRQNIIVLKIVSQKTALQC